MASSLPIGRGSAVGNALDGTSESAGGGNGINAAGIIGAVPTLTLITPSSSDIRLIMDYNKLKGQTNYIYWSDSSKSALEYIGLWDYVSGDVPKPPIAEAASREIWIKNDQKALFLLRNRLEESLNSRVRRCTTSSDLWVKLEEMYKLKGVAGKQAAWENWERVQLKEGGDVPTYLAEHDNARGTVEELGTEVDDEFAALRLLIGLPISWNVFKVTVETGAAERGENLSYDKIYRLISQEDNRRRAEKSRAQGNKRYASEIDQEAALLSTDKPTPKRDLKCSHCGRNGHEKDKCWKIIGYPNDRKRKDEGAKDGEAKVASGTIPFDFVGSFAAKQTNTRRPPKPSTSPESMKSRPSLYMADMDVVLAVKELEGGEGRAHAAQGENNEDPFLLDSGCSFHMCSNLSWFSQIEDYDGPTVVAAGHERHKVTKRGTVCFTSVIDGTKKSFALTDVHYIPNFSNLLSLGALKSRDVKVAFEGTGFTLSSSDGITFAKGSDHPKNLFRLDADIVIRKASEGNVCAATSDEKAKHIMIWHRRLCHASASYLQALAEKKTIIGATKQEIEEVFKTNPCVTCVKGKGHRLPFPNSDNRANIPFELIHSDVKGPVPIQTNGGCRYWLTFVDDSTRYLWTYPLRTKKDVVPITRDWIQLVENQYNLRVKRIRTDNGTEYSKLDPYFQEKGIRRETTVPHTPQQNGRAERVNRSLSEKIACMLIDAGLPASYWAEALLQLTYVLNRSPSRPMEMTTPYEALNGIPPNLSDLHVWGSPCQALILPKQSGFQEKTLDCIFLGYSEMKKGYRLLDVKGKKVIHSREVSFFEVADKQRELQVMPDEINNENSPISSPEETSDANEGNDDVFYDVDEEQGNEGEAEHEENGEVFEDEEAGPEGEHEQEQEVNPAMPRVEARPMRNRREPGYWWIADPVERNRQENEDRNRVNMVSIEENDTYSFLVNKAIPDSEVPATYQGAMQSEQRNSWIKAMDAELDSMKENEVWDLVPLPQGKRVVGCKWVFAIKLDAEGAVLKYKARIVAQGFTQRAGIDFYETYAPVARMNSSRLFFAYTTREKMYIIQADVKTAYLNGEMKEEVYMKPPPGIDNPKGMVCRIKKSLYGLKQSAHEWNNKINGELKKMGFKPLEVEPCVYIRRADGAMIILYVDDIGMAARDLGAVEEIYRGLASRFKMEKLGDMSDSQWLGVRIRRDRERQTVALTQERYIKESLETFGLSTSSPAKSPLPADVDDSPLQDDEAITDMPYLKAIGTLMYLATSTRLDISYAVGMLARFCARPGDRHWDLAMRVFRYLGFTAKYGIVMTGEDGGCPVKVFSDADWAGDHDTRKSTSGCIIKVFGAPVLYASKRQRSISRSTLEAEFIAASTTAQNLQWILYFLNEIGVDVKSPIPFLMDNTSAISAIINGTITDRTKHIDISYKVARELAREGVIRVEYMETENMEADILTKPLTRQRTSALMEKIGIKIVGETEKDKAMKMSVFGTSWMRGSVE